jgi:hypothetical protein
LKFSNLQRTELVGIIASALLVISLFVPWFDLAHTQERINQEAWICGTGEYECTGWATFPIGRWLFLAAAAAPVLLAYFIVREEKGKYPTGEFTMTVGFIIIVLVVFNGILDKPGDSIDQIGISLAAGYWMALGAGVLMAAAGAFRSVEQGGGAGRRPPGTF